jgi:pyruvate formate lyase activating enzyme
LIDYPGVVAATVFTRGCNFRCFFCHNPELVIPQQYSPLLDLETITSYLKHRVGKLGGVCITGGEPLLQPDLASFIFMLKDLGYKVKLDTNGFLSEILEKYTEDKLVDFIAMDIKGTPKLYEKVSSHLIGLNVMDNITKSISLIKNSGIPYEFRTTVCKPAHKVEDFYEIGQMIKGASKYALQNFALSKHVGDVSETESFSKPELENMKLIMSEYVTDVVIR